MSENSSSLDLRQRTVRAIGWPLWVIAGFGIVYVLLRALTQVALSQGVNLAAVDQTLLATLLAAVIYILALLIVIGIPRFMNRTSVNWLQLGIAGPLRLRDIPLAPIAFLIYTIATTLVGMAVQQLIPGFDSNQAQDTGFSRLATAPEYVLAFSTLVLMAPLAEELLFRGYLYGKLRLALPIWLSALLTSVTFGLVHGQWNVGLDVFVLSLVLCGLREVTGSIWVGVLVHMIKNGLAFYVLFVNPAFLHTIGM